MPLVSEMLEGFLGTKIKEKRLQTWSFPSFPHLMFRQRTGLPDLTVPELLWESYWQELC